MRFDVISLFPDMVQQAARVGVTGKAIENETVILNVWNPRDYTYDKHNTVDDRPFGGGHGMVMKYQPLHDAVTAAKADSFCESKVVYLSPQGKPLTQSLLQEASKLSQLILVAGRYEGIDERFIARDCDEEWSLGDYVISGGELAALIVIDAITRLLPNVLGNVQSALQDSHSDGLLDYPQFTRPECIENEAVPDVLLSGHHKDIEQWRMKQALGRTWQKRPDLLKKKTLSAEQERLLAQFKVDVD
ncbi:MAG: tRNA (guanosine(37)-N1)-methyltransferase TrmD [Methylococcales bacterium]|jgi:tRNA (guanine37-N1)-methyltransferase|nr:tRNA (guanosine(37)-N1)-methyltransferase TrmD [Methylococcales bacterium]